MRLLYVAATRAQDRLILSGAVKDLSSIRNSWLSWICKAFGIGEDAASGLLEPVEDVSMQLTLSLLDSAADQHGPVQISTREKDLSPPADEGFPLLEAIKPAQSGLNRFSVTQLLNYHRCPRQYFFDRVLNTPGEEEIGVWNNADVPEPPSNLTATLRGAVIHRFCEVFREGDDVYVALAKSFEAVLSQRAAELAERVLEIDRDRAIHDMLPLARNYVESRVRERIERVRNLAQHSPVSTQYLSLGVLNEQRFRIRRPLGLLLGTIDKLIVDSDSTGLSIEIIDFKTNRFQISNAKKETSGKDQLSFWFSDSPSTDANLLLRAEVEAATTDYKVQMQAYALAVRELVPKVSNLRATLHFLHPNVELSLDAEAIEAGACASAVDQMMRDIVSSVAPEYFPPQPGRPCRACSFLKLCAEGRRWTTSQ
jgi:ATP-dependent exoDNAse (exonuclease V) beta subunit